MIYKSSQHSRQAWFSFIEALQPYDVMCGDRKMDKREIFELLYDENGSPQLDLVKSNLHGHYLLTEREGYKDISLRQQHLEEVTKDVLTTMATEVLRTTGMPDSYEAMVEVITGAMMGVLENHRDIEAAIRKKTGL